jgi:hypothetical protein
MAIHMKISFEKVGAGRDDQQHCSTRSRDSGQGSHLDASLGYVDLTELSMAEFLRCLEEAGLCLSLRCCSICLQRE